MRSTNIDNGPFFVVEKWLGFGNGFSYSVMSEREIMQDESLMLAFGGYDSRPEAERVLLKGIADGTYDCGSH